MSRESFYGGMPGRDFRIAHIFDSYYSDPNDATYTNYAAYDLAQKWASPIGIGEYVVIRYGYPGTETYRKYRALDTGAQASLVPFKYWDEVNQKYETWPLDVTKSGYNGTLWQKVFDEDDTSNNAGISYSLIATMTGDVPVFQPTETRQISADDEFGPRVEDGSDDPANPKLIFYMQKNYYVTGDLGSITPGEIADASEQERNGLEYQWITEADSDHPEATIDTPYLKLRLPDAWDIQLGQVTRPNPQTAPEVEINRKPTNDPAEDNSNTTKYVHLTIPKAQLIYLDIADSHVGNNALDADQPPALRLLGTNGLDADGNYHFMIDLPRAQVLAEADLVVEDPEKAPSIDYDDSTDINHPKYTFHLPRGIKFYYGTSILGKRSEVTYTALMISGSGVGDYYVHETTGFIYRIVEIDKDANTAKYTYVACIQKPLSQVEIAATTAYKLEGSSLVANTPSIAADYSDTTERTGEKITFTLPALPNFVADYNDIGADDTGRVEARPTAIDTFTFSFYVPEGSHFFVGEDVDADHLNTIVAGAKNGDFYLNDLTGYLYKWNGTAWTRQGDYGLQGPTGAALNIIAEEKVNTTQAATIEDVGTYLTSEGYNPDPDQMISVTYVTATESVGYWFYKPGRIEDTRDWAYVKLTGSLSAFTTNEYSTNPDLIYNTIYINGLIKAAFAASDNKDRQTYNATAIDALIQTLTDQITTLTNRIVALEEKVDRDIEEQTSWGKISDLEDEDGE